MLVLSYGTKISLKLCFGVQSSRVCPHPDAHMPNVVKPVTKLCY